MGYQTLRFKDRPLPAINTFGFGQNLMTKVLVDLAEKSAGRFVYIPDQGFVGTGLIHALANKLTSITNVATVDVSMGDWNTSIKNVSIKNGETTCLVLEIPDDLKDKIKIECGHNKVSCQLDLTTRNELVELEYFRTAVQDLLKSLLTASTSNQDKKSKTETLNTF